MCVIVIGRTASIGMCFITSETEQVYRKAVQTFKELFIGNGKVEVFLIDDEIPLKSSLQVFFLGVLQLIYI